MPYGLGRFILILIISLALIQISSWSSIQAKTTINPPPRLREVAKMLASPPPFPAVERACTRLGRTTALGTTCMAASETLQYQEFFWITILLARRLKWSVGSKRASYLSSFIFSCLLFVFSHNFASHFIVGIVILNLLLWYYKSLWPPFILHTVWNFLQPILYPLSLI
jgi:hypothetical protein